jgi:hypothetical protein
MVSCQYQYIPLIEKPRINEAKVLRERIDESHSVGKRAE